MIIIIMGIHSNLRLNCAPIRFQSGRYSSVQIQTRPILPAKTVRNLRQYALRHPVYLLCMSKTLNIFSRPNTANIHLIVRPHSLTDKASDFESEDWGFESLCGRNFLN